MHKALSAKGLEWVHIKKVGDADLKFLEEEFKFHPLDYEDIRSGTPISKLDPYKHYVFAVFHIPRIEDDLVSAVELYVFLSRDKLVTVSKRPIEAIENLHLRFTKNQKLRNSVFEKGPGFLMYQLLLDSFHGVMPIVSHMSNHVAELEEAISDRHKKRTTVQLGRVRRNILYLRHVIDPQRHLLSSLSSLKRPFLKNELHVYFDDVHDVLDTIWLTTDNLKSLIDGLFDVNEALLSHKTNDIVTVLTIFSASIMVPTFIAGFYGMNVSWLPGADNPNFVAGLYIVSFVAVMATVWWIVRRKRL